MSLYLKIPISLFTKLRDNHYLCFSWKKWSNTLSKFHRLYSNCRGLVMFSYAFWQQGRACYIHMFDKIRHLSLCRNDSQYLSSKLIKVLFFYLQMARLVYCEWVSMSYFYHNIYSMLKNSISFFMCILRFKGYHFGIFKNSSDLKVITVFSYLYITYYVLPLFDEIKLTKNFLFCIHII